MINAARIWLIDWLARRRAFKLERMQREMLEHHKFPQ